MDSTVSVSKGVFIFPNGYNKTKSNKKKTQPLFEKIFKKEAWYITYKRTWDAIEKELKDLHHKTYSMLLNDVVDFVKQSYGNDETLNLEKVIPSATLLTGVSQPDHVSQFTALIDRIRDEVTPHVAIINSQDASSVKHLVENAVWQLIRGHDALDSSTDDDFIQSKSKLKKNQCTIKTLKNWYQTRYLVTSPRKNKTAVAERTLVVIIPDFESFNCNVLQDFVMIVSSYVPGLPIVFVFGVATSVSALHKSFPYHVSSKLLIKVFHTHSSPVYMNQVLEDIFLTNKSPFHLSGKALELLTDVFLFYDFSVTGLVQSIKYCIMEHYYGNNLKSLCCERDRIEEAVMNLNSEDLENARQLLSFRPFLERQDCRTKIKLFEDNNFFRETLCKEMNNLHDYLDSFYLCVRLLSVFVKDMPKNGLGKSVREIYTRCAAECITDSPAFKECMQLIHFQSQVKLVEIIKSSLKVVQSHLQNASTVEPLRTTPAKGNTDEGGLQGGVGDNFVKNIKLHLLTFLRQIENANTEVTSVARNAARLDDDTENTPGNRYRLKEKLLRATLVDRVQSEFEMVRARLAEYLAGVLRRGLRPPAARPLAELAQLAPRALRAARPHVLAAPRAALHAALADPGDYLQCSCCQLSSSEDIVSSLPDLCLAYKLHRECGRHINLFDWLQAFAAVLGLDQGSELDAALQLRFTRAVSELQFLGFIKSSKRKTDHVMRLTW